VATVIAPVTCRISYIVAVPVVAALSGLKITAIISVSFLGYEENSYKDD